MVGFFFLQLIGSKIFHMDTSKSFSTVKKFELKWSELSLKNTPQASHYEYFIDQVNFKEIIDKAYGFQNFIDRNNFIGWLNESLSLEDLELSKKILMGEEIEKNVLYRYESFSCDYTCQIPIYTCQCGDIDCSGVAINYHIKNGLMIWNFKDELLGSITFDLMQYRSEIESKIKEMTSELNLR